MASLGMWLTIAGLIAFHFALTLVFQAHPHQLIPFARRAIRTPPGATPLRLIGATLMILGAIVLANAAWYWPLIIAGAGPGAAAIAIARHNRRVRRSSAR